MTVYMILIFGIIAIAFILHPKASKDKNAFLWIVFFALTLVSGFRDYSVGNDTEEYVSMFDNIDLGISDSSRFETGFRDFLFLVHAFSHNPTVFLLVTSILYIGPVFIFVYRYSEDPLLSVLLYIVLKHFFFGMTGIRQALATSFVLLSFFFLLRERSARNYCLGFLMLLLAISFHNLSYVAIIPFALWVVPRKIIVDKITPSFVIKYSIALSVAAYIMYSLIMSISGYLFPKYSYYFEGEYSDSNYSACLFKLLIQFAYLVVGVYYMNRNRKSAITDVDRLSLVMVMFSIIVGTLAVRMECWSRLTGLFSIYTALTWAPSFTQSIRNTTDRITLKISIFLLSFAYMIVTFIYRPEWDGVVPYAFKAIFSS